MDLEEQTSLIPNMKPAKPVKKVRKVNYQNQAWLNYSIAILALIILGLMSLIVIDITGYQGFHLSIKSQENIVGQKNQTDTEEKSLPLGKQNNLEAENYSENLDNLIWDETNNTPTKENEQQVEQNEQGDQYTEEDLTFLEDEDQNNQSEFENNDNIEQQQQQNAIEVSSQLKSPTYTIAEEEEKQLIAEQVEILDTDAQLEQYSLLQSGSNNIILPKIMDSTFNYVQLPNKMKVLLIESEEQQAEIALNVFQGFWDTKYYLKCDLCEISVKEQQTQYLIYTKSKNILSKLNSLSNLFIAETPKLKVIKSQSTQWQQLLSQIANKKHPQSSQYNHETTFQQSPNEMVLIIKGKFKSDELMNGIVQSDIVLLRDRDIQEKSKIKIFNNLGSVLKWNDQQDLNSIRLIYQLESTKDFALFDYFVQTSLKKYIISKQFGLDLKSTVLLDENKILLYQIEIALPYQDQMDYDQRELAYRLSKFVTIFANQLEDLLINNGELTDYCKQMIDQLQQINNLQFDYANEQLDYMEIAKNLMNDQIEEALHYKYLVQVIPKQLLQTLKEVQSTENLLIIVSDSQYQPEYSFLQLKKGSATQDLIFLTQNNLTIDKDGISYSLKEITEQTKQFIQNVDESIKFELPKLNPFIPKSFDLVQSQESITINENAKLLKSQINKFPIIYADIIIYTYGQHLFAEYIYERVMMEYQEAINVGYKFDIGQQQYLQLQISGWSDQYSTTFQGIMNILKEKPNQELKGQLMNKFDMLPDHIKLIKFNIDSIIVSNYQKPIFGEIGQNYYLTLSGNLQQDEASQLDKTLNKALNLKKKSQHNEVKIKDITGKELIYQIKAKDKWNLLINYYQFVQLNQKEIKILDKIQNHISESVQSQHIIFETKQLACSQGFFLIQQQSVDLESQKKILDQFLDEKMSELNNKHKKDKISSFWKNKSGKITFFIDDNKRESNMDNIGEIECK